GRAVGEVLEVAVGTGRNLPFYPEGTRLTGVDWSPAMLGIARLRAAGLGREADLRQGDAQALDFPDESFDTVLCALGLCAIPDDRRAVTEMARVLRPGGRLLLVDHVAASASALRGGDRGIRAVHARHRRARLRPQARMSPPVGSERF